MDAAAFLPLRASAADMKGDWKGSDAVEALGYRLEWDVTGNLNVRQALKEKRETNICFEPGQGSAQAEMNAMAEGKMAVRGASNIEDLGIGEFSFVAIGRYQEERDEFSSLNVLVGDHRVNRGDFVSLFSTLSLAPVYLQPV